MIASAPSSRSRTLTIVILDAERRAASTRRLYIRVLELKARTLQSFDVIDLGTDEVHEAHLVDHALHALDFELTIDFRGLIEVEVVREARAATTDDAQAQRHVALDGFGLADLVDLHGRGRRDLEHRLRTGGIERLGHSGSSEIRHRGDLTLT